MYGQQGLGYRHGHTHTYLHTHTLTHAEGWLTGAGAEASDLAPCVPALHTTSRQLLHACTHKYTQTHTHPPTHACSEDKRGIHHFTQCTMCNPISITSYCVTTSSYYQLSVTFFSLFTKILKTLCCRLIQY